MRAGKRTTERSGTDEDRYAISAQLSRKAAKLIPSLSQTFSKSPTQYPRGAAPVFLKSGKGFCVRDVDGNEYLDVPLALGPIILGHCHPRVTAAVKNQLEDGSIFSLPHPLEIEVAERLVDLIPCAEMVRFGKSGSDATSAAIRLARAATGRSLVATAGYHGWHDWFIGSTTRNLGVPTEVRDLTIPFEYNNLESVRALFDNYSDNIAAIILEPVGIEEPVEGFLEAVRSLAQRYGSVLIFDEVISGFRFSPGGAQQYYGVTPDLACFGKALGNGFPIAAVVGKTELMELFDDVFFSSTFGGDTISLAAAKATIDESTEHDVSASLWANGTQLFESFNGSAEEFGLSEIVKCAGAAPRIACLFGEGDDGLVLKTLFQQECIDRGVLFSGNIFTCLDTTAEEIDHIRRTFAEAMTVVHEAVSSGTPEKFLRGLPVEPVFRKP